MSGQPRTMRSPYMEWAKLHSAARYKLAGSGIKSYPLADLPVRLDQLEIDGPDSYGYPPLQERLAKRNGVAVDCVVAATGTSMANHLAMAALIQAGDEILMEQPTYELLLSLAHYLGAKVLRFPRRLEDGFAIDPQAVRKNLTKRTRLIVITNLHNPSSAPVDEKTLTSIGEMAEQLGARVLVDEVYREAIFDQPTRSAFHLGNHFIVTSSLTKAYGLSGLRCGWILAEPVLAHRLVPTTDARIRGRGSEELLAEVLEQVEVPVEFETGIAPVIVIACRIDTWQLRSTTTMSFGATFACQTILFDVDVPLVTKKQ